VRPVAGSTVLAASHGRRGAPQHAQQLVAALVELVVADRADVEPNHVGCLNRGLVLKVA
jgi:hypothetical protein